MKITQNLGVVLVAMAMAIETQAAVLGEWSFNNQASQASALSASNVAPGVTISNLSFNTDGSGHGFRFSAIPNAPNDVHDGYGFGEANSQKVVFIHRAEYEDNSAVPSPRPDAADYTSFGAGASQGTGAFAGNGNAPISFMVTAGSQPLLIYGLTSRRSTGDSLTFGIQETGAAASPATATINKNGIAFTATFPAPLTIPAGTSKTFTISLDSETLNSAHFIDYFKIDGVVIPDPLGGSTPVTLISHTFDGNSTDALNNTVIDFLHPAITAANGTRWRARAEFKADGSITSDSKGNANIRLGSYIDSYKGTADGVFEFTATMDQPSDHWVALMPFFDAEPNTNWNHTNDNSSVGAFVYQPAGSLRTFLRNVDGDTVTSTDTPATGQRTMTVRLDFTPASGYDGISNFGTITWSDSVLGDIRKQFVIDKYKSVGSVMLATQGGVVNSAATIGRLRELSVRQIPGPVWFPEPIVPATTTLTLVNDPGFNRVNLTLNVPIIGSDSKTTILTGTLGAYFNVNPDSKNSDAFFMLGDGSISASNVNFKKSIIIASYDINVQGMAGVFNSFRASGLMNPASGDIVADGHQFLINAGNVSGSATGIGSINQTFTDTNTLTVSGSGTGNVDLAFTSASGGQQAYAVTVLLPVNVNQDLSGATLTGSGTIKAVGSLTVPETSDFFVWLDELGLSRTDPAANPGADSNHNGTPTVLEYVLNGNPSISGSTNLPQPAVNAQGDFIFSFVRRSNSKSALIQYFDYSSDLAGNWTKLVIPNSSSGIFSIVPIPSSAGLETVTVTVDASEIVDGRIFGRLRVESQL